MFLFDNIFSHASLTGCSGQYSKTFGSSRDANKSILIEQSRKGDTDEEVRYYLGLYQLVSSERTDVVWRREEEGGEVDQEAN